MKNPRIAVTCGDPAGVGPELIAQCLQDGIGCEADLSIIGPPSWLDTLKASDADSFETIEVGLAYSGYEPGKPNPEGSKIALEAMEKAARGCVFGEFDAVVTGPISKARCAEAGFSHPGQTEFFASHWGGEPTMAFVGSKLNVVLATWHVPFATIRYYISVLSYLGCLWVYIYVYQYLSVPLVCCDILPPQLLLFPYSQSSVRRYQYPVINYRS